MPRDESHPQVVATRLIAIKHRLQVSLETCANVLYVLEQLDGSTEGRVLFDGVNVLYTAIEETLGLAVQAVALAEARIPVE